MAPSANLIRVSLDSKSASGSESESVRVRATQRLFGAVRRDWWPDTGITSRLHEIRFGFRFGSRSERPNPTRSLFGDTSRALRSESSPPANRPRRELHFSSKSELVRGSKRTRGRQTDPARGGGGNCRKIETPPVGLRSSRDSQNSRRRSLESEPESVRVSEPISRPRTRGGASKSPAKCNLVRRVGFETKFFPVFTRIGVGIGALSEALGDHSKALRRRE